VRGAIRNKTPIELIQSISGTRPTLIDPLRTAQPSTPTEWDRSSSPSRSACSWDNSFCPANGIHGSGSSAGTILIAAGELLVMWTPINKQLWPPSFAVLMAVPSTTGLACFIWLADLPPVSADLWRSSG